MCLSAIQKSRKWYLAVIEGKPKIFAGMIFLSNHLELCGFCLVGGIDWEIRVFSFHQDFFLVHLLLFACLLAYSLALFDHFWFWVGMYDQVLGGNQSSNLPATRYNLNDI